MEDWCLLWLCSCGWWRSCHLVVQLHLFFFKRSRSCDLRHEYRISRHAQLLAVSCCTKPRQVDRLSKRKRDTATCPNAHGAPRDPLLSSLNRVQEHRFLPAALQSSSSCSVPCRRIESLSRLPPTRTMRFITSRPTSIAVLNVARTSRRATL